MPGDLAGRGRCMKPPRRICVNCGANPGRLPAYRDSARQLGAQLAKQGIEIVYGGADVGLMGEVANAALEGGGKVIGVIPEGMHERVGHKRLTELHVVSTMHHRKQKMFDLADAFIALPGGMGTLEEVFEILTWAQLRYHAKPCGLLNVEAYFDPLLEFLDHAVRQRFIKIEHRQMLIVGGSPAELLEKFRQHRVPDVEKWTP